MSFKPTQQTFVVQYGTGRKAKFMDAEDALAFARAQSCDGRWSEVHAHDGIVGQFDNGNPTPEFVHLRDTATI